MTEQELKTKVPQAANSCLAALDELPSQRDAIMRKLRGEKKMKRKIPFGVLVAALVGLALLGTGYAAFSSQVAEFFGKFYGKDTQSWLEAGKVAQLHESVQFEGLTFTLEEAVYRGNTIFGTGTIHAEAEDILLFPDDYAFDESLNVTDAGRAALQAARESGKTIVTASFQPEKSGVDGSELMTPGVAGYFDEQLENGDLRFGFEMTDALALSEGTQYTLQMTANLIPFSKEGALLMDQKKTQQWTVSFIPVKMPEATAAPAETAHPVIAQGLLEYEVIVPEEYRINHTLPVYTAVAYDFTAVDPTLFSQAEITEQTKDGYWFSDGSMLDLAPEALFYHEYDGMFAYRQILENGTEIEPYIGPKRALSDAIASLASWSQHGFPGTHQVYTLDKTELTRITLTQAQQTFEALLNKLNLQGYVCDYALDMSVERIHALGSLMNEAIENGSMFTNGPIYDYSAVGTELEGFYLSYHPAGMSDGGDDRFSAYAYVTERGIVSADLRCQYARGDVLTTPEAFVTAEEMVKALPGLVAASRYPDTVEKVLRVSLGYAPMHSAESETGYVISPVWMVTYQDSGAAKQGYTCWAEFDAVTGRLVDATFQ